MNVITLLLIVLLILAIAGGSWHYTGPIGGVSVGTILIIILIVLLLTGRI